MHRGQASTIASPKHHPFHASPLTRRLMGDTEIRVHGFDQLAQRALRQVVERNAAIKRRRRENAGLACSRCRWQVGVRWWEGVR